MDFGVMLSESFAYTKEGVLENTNKWFMLMIATLIFSIPLGGYIMKIFRGERPAPKVTDWDTLFIDGIKLCIVGLIYYIPVIILEVIMFVIIGAAFVSGDSSTMMAGAGIAGLIGLVMILLAIIIAVFLPIAVIRFARTNNFGEAFNFGAILETIGKIGWVSYIIALIIGAIVIGIPVGIVYFILMMIAVAIPIVGILILVVVMLIIMPLVAVFHARYITQIFDSIGSA